MSESSQPRSYRFRAKVVAFQQSALFEFSLKDARQHR
jgi:hypothetical protein